MNIAACAYGKKYLPMLLCFLESWSRWGNVTLLCDLPAGATDCLRRAYPGVKIVDYPVKVAKSTDIRISQKMIFWEYLGKIVPPDATIFADIDTIALKDPSPILAMDINVTQREPSSMFYLNTGVVALSQRALESNFLSAWRAETERIIFNPELLAIATSRAPPYGGGDQMAIMKVLGLPANPHFDSLTVALRPCDTFNACSNRIIPDAHVVHLKAALHDFLLSRKPLIGDRQAKDSIMQLDSAIRTNSEGLQRLKEAGVPDSGILLFKFKLPRMLRADYTVPSLVSTYYRAQAAVRATVGRVRTKLTK